MDNKRYTKEQLVKKYSGKFIETYRVYDYQNHINMYELHKVSSVIKENYNPPEELEA